MSKELLNIVFETLELHAMGTVLGENILIRETELKYSESFN